MYDYELPVTTEELYAASQRNNREARALEAAGDPDGAKICRQAALAFLDEFSTKANRKLIPFTHLRNP